METPSTMMPGPTTPIHPRPVGIGGAGISARTHCSRPERGSSGTGAAWALIVVGARVNGRRGGGPRRPVQLGILVGVGAFGCGTSLGQRRIAGNAAAERERLEPAIDGEMRDV